MSDDEKLLEEFNAALKELEKRQRESTKAAEKESKARTQVSASLARKVLRLYGEFKDEVRTGPLRKKFDELTGVITKLGELDNLYPNRFVEKTNPYGFEPPNSDNLNYLGRTLIGSGVLNKEAKYTSFLKKLIDTDGSAGSPFYGSK